MVLAFDCAGAYSFEEALYLGRALDELNFHWYEDPVPHQDLGSLAALSSRLNVPIAISDAREFRFAEASLAIDQRAARILIGDPKKDGITGLKKLAALCEAHHLQTHFHYGGNSFLNAAVLNVALSVRNCDLYPVIASNDRSQIGLAEELDLDPEGYVQASEKAGQGIDIDWPIKERFTEAVL